MQLTNDGVYLLPDGREVIARRAEGSGYHLFDPRLGPAAAPIYFAGEEGKISFWVDRFPGTLKSTLPKLAGEDACAPSTKACVSSNGVNSC